VLPPGLNLTVMAAGYLLVMSCLAAGLLLARGRPGGHRLPAARRGWGGLTRRVAGTAVGGYVLLMAVVVGYYEGVAHLGGDFLTAAFTETALLVALTVPAYVVASRARARVRRRRRRRRRPQRRWRGR
jgi:hypothetical protein